MTPSTTTATGLRLHYRRMFWCPGQENILSFGLNSAGFGIQHQSKTFSLLEETSAARPVFAFCDFSSAVLSSLSPPSLSSLSPPLPPQVISINKAINTQEVAVKEKHARNILTLSLLLFPFSVRGDKRLNFIMGSRDTLKDIYD